jgi:putative ABC transport system permease protein
MSLLSRIVNAFRGDRLSRELDEEFAAHIEDAIRQGRDSSEARRAFGSPLRQREASHDTRVVAWIDSLCADAVFGWRQLRKRKATSVAAILSLGLAVGACTSVFRIIDAVFLRPLQIANPDRLYGLSQPGFAFTYTQFRQMRESVKEDPKDQTELIAISAAPSLDLTYGPGQEIEKANIQFVSGWMFGAFGLRPALGRLLTESDDLKPGASPVAVLSYDYWTRRFARDPSIIGSTVRMGPDWRIGESSKSFEIVGVSPERFTGTEPGAVTDIFVPNMMHALVELPVAALFQTYVLLAPGGTIEPVRDHLLAALRSASTDLSRVPKTLGVESAVAGAFGLRTDYRQALAALGVLVGLVLLIASANVANLMTAQAAARTREMALRVSIGAGRQRLIQMVLVESAILALFAAVAGGLFAWWAGPFVVSRINPPDNPARLLLALDWRVATFALALTLGVTILFGLAPALRASAVKPASALKGGDDPHASGRMMHTLIAVQIAFSFLVLFIAGLFITTFERLSNQPTGISAARLLNLNIITLKPTEPSVFWDQVAERLRDLPGVESVAFSDWPVLDGNGYKTTGVSIDGAPPNGVTAWDMNISRGWIDTMRIPLLAGRDFLPTDAPGAVIVNEDFARAFFNGENPVGKAFEGTAGAMDGHRFEIVGLVRSARYRYLRQAMLPVAYTNFHDDKGRMLLSGTFVVRTKSANPLALASVLRAEVSRAQPDFRVTSVQTQQGLIDAQTVRERLLAMLALFFAVVALLLAGVGLYGVLDYSVFQSRREIGIRLAIGAQAGDIARRIAFDMVAWIFAGSLAGVALGIASARYIESLLYQVKATDLSSLAAPALALFGAAVLAALPPVMRAIHVDPVTVLRSE